MVVDAPISQMRERIIDAAKDRFFEFGYSKVSMDEIADRVGMSKRTLYKYFPSKEELVRSVIVRHRESMEELVRPVLADSEMDFLEKSIRLAGLVAESFTSIPFVLFNDLEKNANDIFEEHRQWMLNTVITGFSDFLREGIDTGNIRKDIAPEVLTLMYVSTVEAIFRNDRPVRLKIGPAEYYEMMVRLFMEGMLTDYARTSYREKKRKLYILGK